MSEGLTEEQKEFIRTNHVEMPDLIELTRAVFMDDTIDGRSKKGRAVREFLVIEIYKLLILAVLSNQLFKLRKFI